MAPDLGLSSFSTNHTISPSDPFDSCLLASSSTVLRAAWVTAAGRVMLSLTFYIGTMVASSNIQCFQGVSANQDPSEDSLSLIIAP